MKTSSSLCNISNFPLQESFIFRRVYTILVGGHMDIMMNSYDCYNKWKLDISVFSYNM